jgi:hypothetical protein
MKITIPEGWLGEAKYPVIVDPIFGSSSVGVYTTFKYIVQRDYNYYLQEVQDDPDQNVDDWAEIWRIDIGNGIALNKFVCPNTLQGDYKAFFYVDETEYSQNYIWPMVYSDNNNHPKNYIANIPNETNCQTAQHAWQYGVINLNTIAAGSTIWFGFAGDGYIKARFDYGVNYYETVEKNLAMYWLNRYYGGSMSNMFSGEGVLNLQNVVDEFNDPSSNYYNVFPGQRLDYKLSMYLEYYSVAYQRTLTQGVRLTDTRSKQQTFIRTILQNAVIQQVTARVHSALRSIQHNANIQDVFTRVHSSIRSMQNSVAIQQVFTSLHALARIIQNNATVQEISGRVHSAIRNIQNTAVIQESFTRTYTAIRTMLHNATIQEFSTKIHFAVRIMQHSVAVQQVMTRIHSLARTIQNNTAVQEIFGRLHSAIRNIQNTIPLQEAFTKTYTAIRAIQNDIAIQHIFGSIYSAVRQLADEAGVIETTGHIGDYIRGLLVEAANNAKTSHVSDYHRKQTDTAYTEAIPLRHLIIYICLVTAFHVRDFIIGRFIKSNEELVIKSPVCREIEIDSRIH